MKRFLCILLATSWVVPCFGEPPGVRIDGPTERAMGRSVILKITMDGDDLKIITVPKIDNLLLFKILGAEQNQVGVLFDPDVEGIYTFSVGVNRDKLTAVAAHQIRIGTGVPPTPKPPIPPDPPKPPDIPIPPIPIPDPNAAFTSKLQAAYTADLGSGGTVDMKRGLSAGYREGIKGFMTSKTNAELMGKQKLMNEKLIGAGTMMNIRKVIGDDVISVLGTNSLAPLDSTKATALWNKYISSLDRLSPP